MDNDLGQLASNTRARRYLRVILLVVTAICLYLIVSAIIVRLNTGVLDLKADNNKAVLSITALDKSAQIVGQGSASIRLSPGEYLVAATLGANESVEKVTIFKRDNIKATIDMSKSFQIPSINKVKFVGFNAFINLGLTSDQVKAIEKGLFSYNHDIKAAAVDPTSIRLLPHQADSFQPLSRSFGVKIDGVDYSGTVTYGPLQTTSLSLSRSGVTVFES